MSNSHKDILEYYKTRAASLEPQGYDWSGRLYPFVNNGETVGYFTMFFDEDLDLDYVSFYVRESHRGKGAFPAFVSSKWREIGSPRFITVPACDLIAFFEKLEIPYICVKV